MFDMHSIKIKIPQINFLLMSKVLNTEKNLIAITEKDILNNIQFNYKLKLLQLCCVVSYCKI